jgi:GxxExxY protein
MPDTNFKDDLLYKDECYRIVGACFEVYKEKGCGYLESVYQECLAIELALQGIPAIAQPQLKLAYKGQDLVAQFVPDFIVFGKIIIELKALDELTNQHRAQLINYLKATGHELGILVNFGAYPKLEWERIPRSRRLNVPSHDDAALQRTFSRPLAPLADNE